jgi:hypothetical protein
MSFLTFYLCFRAAHTILGPHIWQASAKKTISGAHLDITHYAPLSRYGYYIIIISSYFSLYMFKLIIWTCVDICVESKKNKYKTLPIVL